jgi:hypothetical protein
VILTVVQVSRFLECNPRIGSLVGHMEQIHDCHKLSDDTACLVIIKNY